MLRNAGCWPYSAVRVEVRLGCGKRGGRAGRWLIDCMDKKMQSTGVGRTRYENLLLQGGGEAHVRASVGKLCCGVEAEREKSKTVHDRSVRVGECEGLIHSA
jgi:hypothetical protein